MMWFQNTGSFCILHFKGVAYEYHRLLFGYWLVPNIFSRCLDVVVQALRNEGMRLLFYLDNFIVMAESKV